MFKESMKEEGKKTVMCLVFVTFGRTLCFIMFKITVAKQNYFQYKPMKWALRCRLVDLHLSFYNYHYFSRRNQHWRLLAIMTFIITMETVTFG